MDSDYRTPMIVLTVLVLIAGVALVITGAVAEAKLHKQSLFIGNVNSIGILSIIIGCIICIIFIVALSQDSDQWNDEGNWIKAYFAMTTFILLFVIGLFIAAFAARGQISGWLEIGMKKDVVSYGTKTSVVDNVLDVMQAELHCCGILSVSDWELNEYLKSRNSVPISCCKNIKPNCGDGELSQPRWEIVYTEGCLEIIDNSLEVILAAVGSVAVVVGLLLIIGMCVTGCQIDWSTPPRRRRGWYVERRRW